MYLFTVAYVSIHPYPELLKGGWSAIRTHNVGNQTPDVSGHITVKKQVFNPFINITEKASFITLPISPAKVVFG